MKKLGFAFVALALFLAFMAQARALQITLATKQISVTIVITPSPIVYVPMNATGLDRTVATTARVSRRGLAFDARLRSMRAMDALVAYDPVSLGDMVAQTNPQGSAKVQFTVKVDPTYQYFHLIPGTNPLYAGYGANTFTCAFQVFASYSRAWTVSDDVYGSNTSGGTAGLNGFPTYNYPTTSLLLWLAEGNTTSFAPYANGGTLQTSFTGLAGATKTVCIDLSLSVPSTIPSGTYSASFNYTMSHS